MKDEYKEVVCRVRFIDGVCVQAYLSDVEIVRCKDCKYSVEEYNDGECYCDYNRELRYIKDWDHYCGWAERRTE